MERRLNFPIKIMEAIRAEVGKAWPVGMRISGDEMAEGGYTSDDFSRMVPMLTAGDQLDYLSVSTGIYRSMDTIIAPMYYPNGAFVYLAALAKEHLDIPVMCIGRINDPVMAEQILEDRQADLVGMTRANICDPELPNKAREGRLDEIRHCLGCNEACWGHVMNGMSISCAISIASISRLRTCSMATGSTDFCSLLPQAIPMIDPSRKISICARVEIMYISIGRPLNRPVASSPPPIAKYSRMLRCDWCSSCSMRCRICRAAMSIIPC